MKQKFVVSSRQLLIIDGAGALLTALSVGVIMPTLIAYIGMPLIVLWVLGGVAAGFVCVSMSFVLIQQLTINDGLRVMVILNAIYAIASLILVLIHFDKLTFLAKAYFFLEVLVVAMLVVWEKKMITRKEEPAEQSKDF